MIHSEELTIVVDSGPGDHSYTTVEYIKQFTDEIDVMILTHPHEDHIGAAADIINKIGVETVIMPDVSTETVCFDKLLDAIEENNCTVKEGKAGEKFTFGDIDIDVYAPVSPDHNDLNNCSIIAKITTGDISTLVTGDAESSAEKEVLDNFVTLANELEFKILGLTFSPVKGPEGNIEFLGHLSLADVPGMQPDTADVVAQAHATLKG